MDCQPVLVWLSCHRDYFRFRIPELVSLLTLYYTTKDCFEEIGLTQHLNQRKTLYIEHENKSSDQAFYCLDRGSQSAIALGKDEDVFIVLLLPLSDVPKIASQILNRSVLIKGFYHLWAKAPSYDTIQSNFRVPLSMIQEWINPKKSFSFLIKSFGHCLSETEKIQRMSHFSFLFTSDIKANIKNPDTKLVIFEKWERSAVCDSPTLQQVFFTRTIEASPSRLPWFSKYSLKSRPILGPTTLDHELSFLMANQAKITPGTIVLDPFCGTGSLLLAASHFGALTLGGDIDSRVLKGWGVSRFNLNVPVLSENTSIFQNFIHYDLPVPEILRIDIAAWTRYPVKAMTSYIKPWIDVILTDPPYGVRACVRHVACSTNMGEENTVDKNADFIPATHVTTTTCVINSLLDIASLLLVDHGLLVFLCPVIEINALNDIEALKHPDLKLKAASLQSLSKGTARVLLTYCRIARTSL
ncbi:tRNA (guanine(10)-N2)-methyltransferase homolog isoform X3 [Hylaeus volcanicus]|uniref:tRNA (guanine(10)-N2)-methyltransferase homolog isoform X3 n=1 Tax=Hylaeus volcanicus TaxID=313075 RepID=UPI0023B855A2|nr:tRNA (guanine(10)-N2)-methyltransferase homolog isoform X3 [Hylaeus volcanicus]